MPVSYPERVPVQAEPRAAQELPLEQGLRLERRLWHPLFATQDQKEG